MSLPALIDRRRLHDTAVEFMALRAVKREYGPSAIADMDVGVQSFVE